MDEVLPSVDGGMAYVVLDCEQHRRVFVNPPSEQVRIQKKDRLTSPAPPQGEDQPLCCPARALMARSLRVTSLQPTALAGGLVGRSVPV